MMRSWTLPLSSWRWASAACCMGMDVCARRRSWPSASRAIVSSRAPGARSGVYWENVTPKSAAAGSAKVMTRLGPPARAIASARTPLPAASNTASTAPSARTRLATPAPYRTGVAPSSRASVSSCSPTALITLIPRATASCVAMMPTDPPPPNSSSVSPLLTFSCRRTPTAASAELGSAAASIHETVSGLRVQIDASAYSAYPPRLTSRAVTPSPMDVPVTPGPTASTVPAAAKPSTAFGGSGMALREPARRTRSVGLMPAALILILICPSPGSRSGTPAHFSTSGGPYPVITTALGIAVPSFLVAASVWPRTATSACSLCAVSCSIDRALRRGRRFPAPLAGQIDGACWRRADARAGAAQQGQRAHGGDDGGDDQRAAGACGVVGDPADRRSRGQGALQRGDEQGQAGSRLPR